MDDAAREALRAKYERVTPSLPRPRVVWTGRSPRRALLVVCLLIFLGQLFSLRVPLQRSDDFYKVIGALSLAAGKGYSDISRPDAPFLTKYPPLDSLLLAPFVGLVGDFLRPLRLLSLFTYVASIPLAYRLLVRRVSPRVALWLLVLSGLNPVTLRSLNFEGYTAMVPLTLLTLTLMETSDPRVRHRGLWLGLTLVGLFYTHRIGIVLAAACLLYLVVVQKAYRAAGTALLISVVLCFPWLWRSYHVSGHWISVEYEDEIRGRSMGGQANGLSGLTAVVRHMGAEVRGFPASLGYGLFPWSHASGGQYWPFLERLHLTGLAVLSDMCLVGFLLLGWAQALRRQRGFVDLYLIVHTLMLMVFFVGLQYFVPFLPWLYLYVAQGARLVLGRLPASLEKKALAAGLALLLLVCLAKDTRAFWLYPAAWRDRDYRWQWVERVVPHDDTVYYLGLSNYALSQLRFFDSGRKAVGLDEAELKIALADPSSPIRWVCLAKTSPYIKTLQAQGWIPVASEGDFALPTAAQRSGMALSRAQEAYLELMEPPQGLWSRQ